MTQAKRARVRQRGQVLIATLIVCLFLAFLGAAALFSAFYENANAVRRAQRTQAEGIARAGIEQVIYWFNNSDKAPGSIAQQTGRTDWGYNYIFVHRGEDGYTDNDGNGFFSPGDTLKTSAQDPLWYDFNGNGQYDSVLTLINNPDSNEWVPYVDVIVAPEDYPTFPNGRIERLVIYAAPPGSNPELRARATILCVATARSQSGTETYAKVVMRCVIKEFRPFGLILGGVNVHGVAEFSGNPQMHWGKAFVLDGEPYTDADKNRMYNSPPDTYVDTNANGQFDSQNAGTNWGTLDFGSLNIASKVDTNTADPWLGYFAEKEMLTNRPFTSGDFKTLDSVETYTIPTSYTPMPDGASYYHLHRWILDTFVDNNRNAKWDAGGSGTSWDLGLDGTAFTNDRGEGNGTVDAEPAVDGSLLMATALGLKYNAQPDTPVAQIRTFWDHNANGTKDSESFNNAGLSEVYHDVDANGTFDGGERIVDLNGSLRWDHEPFADSNGNGKYDVLNPAGEPYTDLNGNGQWDPDTGEPFTDLNANAQWDTDGGPAESFTDSNANAVWDPAELFTDTDGDGVWDPAKKVKGEWQPAEPFVDVNGNGQWDAAEPFTDTNGNGQWDPTTPEPFTDLNGNGTYDGTGVPEPYTDTNGNGHYDAVIGEPYSDYGLDGIPNTNDYGEGNGQYDQEPFEDDGVNGKGAVIPAWVKNGKCDGDPWMDVNSDGVLNGEAMFDKNRNYRADQQLPFPMADYDALKAYAKRVGTYYYADSSNQIHNEQGAIVNFQSEWQNKTGFYFVDTKDQTKPRYGASSNLCSISISGSFYTGASIYVGGDIIYRGAGTKKAILAKNPGELRNDSNGNGSYDAPNGEWTSTDPRGFTVHHASGMETYYDANGNGIYDYGEWFRDSDGDGKCDVEEYIDDLNPDGQPDDQANFSTGQTFRFGPYTNLGGTIGVDFEGVVYCAGQFDGGGNCVIYGAVVAHRGFAAGGTPDVYYNVDLSFGMGNGILINIMPVSWEILNR